MKKELVLDDNLMNIKVERQVRVRDILVDVPLRYKCSAINVLFPISTKEAKKIIGTPKIKPLELFPGRSLLCITLFDYQYSPVGPYTEISLSIPVNYNFGFNVPLFSLLLNLFFNKLSFFVFSIAQSTQIAIEHGLIITGYPKYDKEKTVDAKFSRGDKFIYVNVSGEGKMILNLKIMKLKNEKLERSYYPTYFVKNNKICKIQLETDSIINGSKILSFELGDHKIAELIKSLKISPNAVYAKYYKDAIEILYSPKEIEAI